MNGNEFLEQARMLAEGGDIDPKASTQLLFAGMVDLMENQYDLKSHIGAINEELREHIDRSNAEMRKHIGDTMQKRDEDKAKQVDKLESLLGLQVIRFNQWANGSPRKFGGLMVFLFLAMNVWMVSGIRAKVLELLPFVPDNWVEFLTTGG